MCEQTILGTNYACEAPLTPWKYLLEDLPGVSIKSAASIAEESGRELLDKVIRMGIDKTMNDVLYYRTKNDRSPIINFNTIQSVYYQQEFSTRVQTGQLGNGDRGISFTLTNPSYYQFSSLFLRTVYIKTVNNATFNVNVYSNGQLIYTENITTIGGQTYTLSNLNLMVSGNDVSITYNQDAIDVYQAVISSQNCCGYRPPTCDGCGFDFTYKHGGRLKVEGGFGVTADLDVICNEEKFKCAMLPYFGQEARLQAGIALVNEALVSSRMNFFTINNIEALQELASMWLKEYNDLIISKVPSMRMAFKSADNCCFKNTYINTKTLLV